MLQQNEVQLRDPFVFTQAGTYYLYGTTDKNCWKGEGGGFEAYTSTDLRSFQPEGRIFTPDSSFWGKENFWAPEMHKYGDKYFLFASFKAPWRRRATAILAAASPLGPFTPWGEEAVTPSEWECLDGTLYVDDQGDPWVVFCHEWVQIGDGTVCARRLKQDLSGALGEPVTLFSASEAKWSKQIHHSSGIDGYVTDGPFLYRMQTGALLMLWSSHSESGYAIGQAISDNGLLTGTWRQLDTPLFCGDGGHGMLFTDLSGQLCLTIHSPNKTPNERPAFIPILEEKDGLRVLK